MNLRHIFFLGQVIGLGGCEAPRTGGEARSPAFASDTATASSLDAAPPAQQEKQRLSSPPPPRSARTINALAGTWRDQEDKCYTSTHEISFAKDGASMEIRYDEHTPFGSLLTYDVLRIDGNEVETQLRGENRKSDTGELVRWILILTEEEKSYCWRRSDWKVGVCSEPRHLCSNSSLHDWSSEGHLHFVDGCLQSLEEDHWRRLAHSRKLTPTRDTLDTTCRCSAYELRADFDDPEKLETVGRALTMLGCLSTHALRGDWPTNPELVSLMCSEVTRAQGVQAEAADAYCACSVGSIDAGLSESEILARADGCARQHLAPLQKE